jgi:hypothetical protein
MDDTTVSDVYDHLELLGLVPSRLHQLYFTHLGRRVAWVDEMRSLGLGALSHLHLHIRRLGGTGGKFLFIEDLGQLSNIPREC